jgi:hypothetical protein
MRRRAMSEREIDLAIQGVQEELDCYEREPAGPSSYDEGYTQALNDILESLQTLKRMLDR